jgi:hypothetical protein
MVIRAAVLAAFVCGCSTGASVSTLSQIRTRGEITYGAFVQGGSAWI